MPSVSQLIKTITAVIENQTWQSIGCVVKWSCFFPMLLNYAAHNEKVSLNFLGNAVKLTLYFIFKLWVLLSTKDKVEKRIVQYLESVSPMSLFSQLLPVQISVQFEELPVSFEVILTPFDIHILELFCYILALLHSSA